MRGLGRAIGALVWVVAASATAAGTSVDRHYDLKGRLDRITHRKGSEVLAKIAYGFDSRDRRRTVDYEHLNLRSTFEYTDNNWLKHETHARRGSASAGGGPEGLNEEASLDGGNESAPTGDLAVSPVAGPAPVTLFEAAYGYDLRGNRLAKTVLVGSTPSSTYLPDEEDRLIHEMRGDLEIAYAYSDRGEMTSKTEGSVTTDFNTDYLGRIVGVNSLGKSWSYLFAPTGDRIAKYNNLATSENEWSLPDGGDTLADYHKTESAEEFSGLYVSPGVDGRVARIDSAGAPQYYFGDALQSVHQVTDATGAVTGTNFSDAWGNKLAIGPPPPTGPGSRYGFTGRENDAESGLMHYRARSYDPMVGRFISRDPVPFSNLYIYAHNDPANKVDPLGNWPWNVVEQDDRKKFREHMESLHEYKEEGNADGYRQEYLSLLKLVDGWRNKSDWSSYNSQVVDQAPFIPGRGRNSKAGLEVDGEVYERTQKGLEQYDRLLGRTEKAAKWAGWVDTAVGVATLTYGLRKSISRAGAWAVGKALAKKTVQEVPEGLRHLSRGQLKGMLDDVTEALSKAQSNADELGKRVEDLIKRDQFYIDEIKQAIREANPGATNEAIERAVEKELMREGNEMPFSETARAFEEFQRASKRAENLQDRASELGKLLEVVK